MASELENVRSELRELGTSELDHVTGGGVIVGGGGLGAGRASLVESVETIQLYPIVIGGQPPSFDE